jgi:hypothetical protein
MPEVLMEVMVELVDKVCVGLPMAFQPKTIT